jgi:hypothetical protein
MIKAIMFDKNHAILIDYNNFLATLRPDLVDKMGRNVEAGERNLLALVASSSGSSCSSVA